MATDQFLKLANQWLSSCPPVTRLAFGAVLNIVVNDRVTGYRRIASYLPNVRLENPDEALDFMYQINRRRASKVTPGLPVNRLSKWSVPIAKFAQIAIGPNLAGVVAPNAEYTLARLEIDISTAVENHDPFAPEQLAAIWLELVEFGQELAIKGDIP